MPALPANRYVLPGVPPPAFGAHADFLVAATGVGVNDPRVGPLPSGPTLWFTTRGPTPLCWPRAYFLPRRHSMVPNVAAGKFFTLLPCAVVIFSAYPQSGRQSLT